MALRNSLSLALVLFAFWLLISGIYLPLQVGAGIAVSVAAVWFARRMESLDAEGHPVHLGRSALTYWPWLLWEIVKSALTVSRIILDPRLPISPTLARFRPGQRTVVGLVTHANSITLTPGTISVEVRPGEFVVHALTRGGAQALAGSEMDRRVRLFEEGR
jgi:multicomponent Na+:H+ antiporter subunit E